MLVAQHFAVLLLVSSLSHVSAHKQEPDSMEALGHDAVIAGTRARAASSDVRSTVAETRARINAEAVERSMAEADGAAFQAVQSQWTVKGATDEAAKQAAGAAASEAEAEKELASGETLLNGLEETAGAQASADVTTQLASVYKGLEEWRVAVLRPPAREQRLAGMRAAQPYEQSIQKVEAKILDKERKAAILGKEAVSLRAAAYGLSSTATAKQAAGDQLGASRDSAAATEMMGSANSKDGQRTAINGELVGLRGGISPYVTAAQSARRAAEQRYAGSALLKTLPS